MAERTRGRGKEHRADGGEGVTALAVVPKAPLRGRNPRSHQPQDIITLICKRLVGGKQTFMELARMAPQLDPNCACVIEEWDRIAGQKRSVSLFQICKLKNIDPFHFIGVVGEAAIKFRDNASVIIAALGMPGVIERSVKTALTRDGFKDREALMKHSGFLPVPAGGTFVNTFAAKIEQNNEVIASAALPSFEKTIELADDEEA